MSFQSTYVKVTQGIMSGLFIAAVGQTMLPSGIEYAPKEPTTVAPTKAERLMERHDCWSGEAPPEMEGKFPGHVVVTSEAGVTVLGGERMVGYALDQLFKGHAYGLTIHGFCK